MWVASRLSGQRIEAGYGAGAGVASLCRRGAANRDGCGECLIVTRATLCQARPRMALGWWWVDSDEGLGENGPFPSVGAMLPLSAACWF